VARIAALLDETDDAAATQLLDGLERVLRARRTT
jgi:hypothetical protein